VPINNIISQRQSTKVSSENRRTVRDVRLLHPTQLLYKRTAPADHVASRGVGGRGVGLFGAVAAKLPAARLPIDRSNPAVARRPAFRYPVEAHRTARTERVRLHHVRVEAVLRASAIASAPPRTRLRRSQRCAERDDVWVRRGGGRESAGLRVFCCLEHFDGAARARRETRSRRRHEVSGCFGIAGSTIFGWLRDRGLDQVSAAGRVGWWLRGAVAEHGSERQQWRQEHEVRVRVWRDGERRGERGERGDRRGERRLRGKRERLRGERSPLARAKQGQPGIERRRSSTRVR
jgi:hypothetical protein